MRPPIGPSPGTTQNMTVENKQKVLDVITTLRSYQLIGIVEARNWIEFLFPEFGEFRDREADEMFSALASLSAGRDDSPPDGDNPGKV